MEINNPSLYQVPLPEDPTVLGLEFTPFLEQFSKQLNAPYVYKKAIAYRHSTDRAKWAPHLPKEEDPQSRSTFSEFWTEKKDGKKAWLGCFTTTTENTVRPDWDDQIWHVWGVAVIASQQGHGKHVIIWDCDPRPTIDEGGELRRQRDIMFGFQRDFVKFAEKAARIRGVWYNVDTSKSRQDQCLVHTLEWIQDMVSKGDVPFNEGGDTRVENCILLSRR